MVEKPSSAPDFITSPELEKGIVNGSITTFTIMEDYLRYYLEAASMTNFEVIVIAEQGKYYITYEVNPAKSRFKKSEQKNNTPTITPVKSHFPVRKDCLAISLKRPEGVTNDMAFNIALQKIQRI